MAGYSLFHTQILPSCVCLNKKMIEVKAVVISRWWGLQVLTGERHTGSLRMLEMFSVFLWVVVTCVRVYVKMPIVYFRCVHLTIYTVAQWKHFENWIWLSKEISQVENHILTCSFSLSVWNRNSKCKHSVWKIHFPSFTALIFLKLLVLSHDCNPRVKNFDDQFYRKCISS